MAAMQKITKQIDVGKLTRIGMMCALSAVLGFFPEIPMAFFAPWLKLDFAYVPMLLTGFSLGFWPGFVVLTVKNIFQFLTSNSAGIGQLADMIVGTAMLAPCVLVYRQRHTLKGAVISMLAGIVTMVVVSVVVNRFIMLPLFFPGDKFQTFMNENPGFLWIAVAPFNLVKGAAVSLVTFVLYKRLAPFLKRGMRA